MTRLLRPVLVGLLFALAAWAEEPAAEPAKVIAFPGGGRCYPAERRIEIDGVAVYPTHAPIELFACAQHGKEHESVLALSCIPQDVHFALLIFGLRDDTEFPGQKGPQTLGDPAKPVGDRVIVSVQWELDGKQVKVRAEELLTYGPPRDRRTMPQVGWTFAGSERWERVDPDTNLRTGETIYMANRERTLVSTYHDPSAVLDNPLVSGGDDRMLHPNFDRLPPRGTKVTLVLEVPDEATVAAMKQAEADADAEYLKKIEAEWKTIDETAPTREELTPEQIEERERVRKEREGGK